MFKSKCVVTVLLVIAVVLPAFVYAQDPGGNPDDVPLDGGIGLLLAAGVGYGVKKFRDAKKKKPLSGNDIS